MTEQEKIQELLKPRVKIIAPWPDVPKAAVGNIYVLGEDEPGYWYTTVFGKTYTQSTIDEYPHLFKRLEWWEDRKPDEMPEYVKPTEDAVMEGYSYPVKITGYHKVYPEWFYCEEYPGATMTLENFIPATLAEYTQYINSKQQP